MANTIRLKSGSGNDPSASDLVVGEVALRTDGNPKLFTKNDAGSVLEVGLGSLNDKLPLAGGTLTGNVTLDKSGTANITIKSSNDYGTIEVGGSTGAFIDLKSPATDDFDTRFTHDGFIYAKNNITLSPTSGNVVNVVRNLNAQEGLDVTGVITGTSHIDLPDDATIKLGDNDEFQIFHRGNDSVSLINEQGGGYLSFGSNGSRVEMYDIANSRVMAKFNTGGSCEFKHAADIRLETTSTGIAVTGRIAQSDATGGANTFGTNVQINTTFPSISLNDSNSENDFQIQNQNGLFVIKDFDRNVNVFTIEGRSGQSNYGETGIAGNLSVTGNITATGGQLTLENGNEEQIHRFWSSTSDSDINSLLSNITSSTFGTIVETAHNGHHIVGLRDNDGNDSFAIISGGNNFQTDSTYDTLIARFKADGNTIIGGNLDVNSTCTATTFSGSGASLTNIPAGQLTGTLPALDGSNLTGITVSNANTLDNLDSTQFLRSDVNDQMNGNLVLNTSNDEHLILQGSSDPYIRFREGTTNKAYIQWNSNGNLYIVNQESGEQLVVSNSTDGLVFVHDGTASKVWHAGNDGSGSTLDADTVDNIQASSFLRSDSTDTATGALTLTRELTFSSDDDGVFTFGGGRFYKKSGSGVTIRLHDANTPLKIENNSGTFLGNVFHSGNDGSGSGLDADTVDNIHASSFLRSDTSDTITGNITFSNDGTGIFLSGGGFFKKIGTGLIVRLPSGGQQLQCENNSGTVIGTYFHSGIDGSGSGLDSDTLDNIHASSFLRSDADDTATGAIQFTNTGLQLSGHWFNKFYSGTQNFIHLYPGGHNGNASTTDIRPWNGTTFDVLRITGGSNNITWRTHKIWNAGNDGSGSGLDSDTLDSIHASSFLRSDANDSASGTLQLNGKVVIGNSLTRPSALDSDADAHCRIGGSDVYLYIASLNESGGYKLAMQAARASDFASFILNLQANGGELQRGGNKVWDAGNDGSGSGLDADTVDNIQASSFLRSDADDTMSANLTIDNGTSTTLSVKCDNAGLALIRANGDSQGTGAVEVGQADTYGGGIAYNGDGSPSFASGEQADHITFYRLDNGTRTEVFHYPYNSNTVNFNARPTIGGVDIVKSTDTIAQATNASTLDNIDSGSFLRSDADDTVDARLTFANNQNDNHDDMATSTAYLGGLEIINSGGGNDAFMAFHAGGDFACYFGLDADSNRLAVGGWSMGAVKYSILHTNFASIRGSSAGQGYDIRLSMDGTRAAASVGHNATHAEGIFWHTSNNYGIYRTAGNWSGNYSQLRLDWPTGIVISGGTQYGLSHVRFESHLLPNVDNERDLGSTSLRWRNIYTNDLNLSNEGGANDVDGTWGSFTIQEGEEDLFLINKRNGKKYKINMTEVS